MMHAYFFSLGMILELCFDGVASNPYWHYGLPEAIANEDNA